MAQLKTNYVDDELDLEKNTNRKYIVRDADGNIIHEGISIEEVTEFVQEGSRYGAADLNATNEAVNSLNENLTEQTTNKKFIFDCKDGQYGWNESEERGADTFHPFKSGNEIATVSYGGSTTTRSIPIEHDSSSFIITCATTQAPTVTLNGKSVSYTSRQTVGSEYGGWQHCLYTFDTELHEGDVMTVYYYSSSTYGGFTLAY